MHLALTGTFRAHWSAEDHDEWVRNLLKNRPDITRDKLELTRRLMDHAAPDALVTGYESLTDPLELPDPDDRHVLAAAIHFRFKRHCRLNLADFPSQALGKFGIEAQHPDDFVVALIETFPDFVLEPARKAVIRRYRRPR